MTHCLTVLLIVLIQLLCFNSYIQLTKTKVFVANRAADILKNSTIDEWKHVKGEMNPFDIGTRGITIEKLTKSDWLSGTIWLTDHPDLWLLSL